MDSRSAQKSQAPNETSSETPNETSPNAASARPANDRAASDEAPEPSADHTLGGAPAPAAPPADVPAPQAAPEVPDAPSAKAETAKKPAANKATPKKSAKKAAAKKPAKKKAAKAKKSAAAKAEKAGPKSAAPKPEAPKVEAPKPAATAPRPETAKKPSLEASLVPQGLAKPDAAALAANLATVGTQVQRLLLDTVKRRRSIDGEGIDMSMPMNMAKAFMPVVQRMVMDPRKLVEGQISLWQGYLDIWQRSAKRLMGEAVSEPDKPGRKDKRFRGDDWQQSILFDFIKQTYLFTSDWLVEQVHEVEGLDRKTQKKAEFYAKQFADALSPSNFILTNPEVLRETLRTNGENLVKGVENLMKDLERGHGHLSIQQTDMSAFEVGGNIALSPGKVIYRNELMELLQYEPSTEKVYKRPLLIFPPWINKFYILDLRPENSFIKWAVSKGYTVFVASWVNPDARLAQKSFEDYMFEGVLEALDAVEQATGEKDVNAIGYCIGGTMLSATLAYMAATGDDRIKSATFFAAQTDFTEAGDLQVFIDEEQLDSIEKKMEAHGGVLDAHVMAQTFNMLRSNDLIWNYVVSNYLMGKDPFPFDLLYWNADATRLPQRMHLFYLRHCYLRNDLARGRMVLGGERIDLSKVKIPIYLQSSKEDHIAPARSIYKSTKLFGGPVTFMMAGSGHIAGVINHPDANKYQHWTNKETPATLAEWQEGAVEAPGSWWPSWEEEWLRGMSGPKVKARKPGDGKLPALEDTPGTYVKIKAV